ncbi:MAG: hypothetical protein AAF902_04725 [Chloroflexota bacterium]
MQQFLRSQLHYLLGTAFVSILGTILSLFPGSTNDLPDRPPAPTPTMAAIATVPPVDDPIITPTATPRPAEASADDRGSLIVLQSSSADADDWVTVEWLAGDGTWYEVDGWRGHIHNGQLIWWVAPDNLGDGMFRWVVYSNDTKAFKHRVSDPFYLPEQEKITRTFPLDW